MAISPLLGRPGFSATRTFGYGEVFLWADDTAFFPGGGVISGDSRDYGNSTNLLLLRPGLLMGKVTATGEYRPSISGVLQGAYTSGGTSVTVTAAQAVEIARRVGTSGNLTYIGPPSAAGTVAITGPIAFSAINTGTGVITVTSLGVNKIAGTFVVAGDGSELPKTVIPGSMGIELPTDSSDVDFPRIPFRGLIDVTKVIDYPSDTSLKQWIKDQMAKNGAGQFTYSDEF